MRGDSDVNYAANPYGMPPEQRRKRALPKSLLWTVAGITLFAGGVVGVMSFTGAGGVSGPPPMIEADATPMKSRPADNGGGEAVAPDRLVYERLSGATRPSVERLLPPPEQPMPRPIVAAEPSPPPPEPPRAAAPAPSAPPPANMLATPSAPPAKPAPGQPPQSPPSASATTGPQTKPPPAAPPPAAKPPAQTPAAQTPAAPPATLKPPAQVAAAQPPGAPPTTLKPPGQGAPAPAASGSGGGWRIQLASVRSEAEAAAEWKRLQSRFPGVLGGMGLSVSKADLGEKGVYYRVHGGAVDEARAKAACDQLKSQNVGCVVVKP